jgi:hypothetical protein
LTAQNGDARASVMRFARSLVHQFLLAFAFLKRPQNGKKRRLAVQTVASLSVSKL